jgi:hypothetical protein
MKKCIVGIILAAVLIGATLSPTITAVQQTHQFTIELSNSQGTKKTTFSLPERQAEKLQEILDRLDERLSKTTNTAERYQVYTSTVAELYPFGVFGNISLPQAQHLVTFWYEPEYGFVRNLLSQTSNITNAFCLVSGHTDNTVCGHRFTNWLKIGGLPLLMLGIILLYVDPYSHTKPHLILGFVLASIGLMLYYTGSILTTRADANSIALGDIVGIGWHDYWSRYYFGNGWVHSIGVLGKKDWNGTLRGTLPGIYPYDWPLLDQTYEAMWGFSGISIWRNEDGSEKSYIGSALAIGVQQLS